MIISVGYDHYMKEAAMIAKERFLDLLRHQVNLVIQHPASYQLGRIVKENIDAFDVFVGRNTTALDLIEQLQESKGRTVIIRIAHDASERSVCWRRFEVAAVIKGALDGIVMYRDFGTNIGVKVGRVIIDVDSFDDLEPPIVHRAVPVSIG